MNRRASDRMTSELYVKLFCGKESGTAAVKNISKSGMLINPKLKLLPHPRFQVIVHFKDEKIRISARIRRVIVKGHTLEGIGIELENPPEEYLNIINSMLPERSRLQ